MQFGFLMPTKAESERIKHLQRDIDALRPDQRDRVLHLVRSWRVCERPMWFRDSIGQFRKAIRNARNNLP